MDNFKIEYDEVIGNKNRFIIHTFHKKSIELIERIRSIPGVYVAEHYNYHIFILIAEMHDNDTVLQLIGKEIDLYCFKNKEEN